MFKSLISFNLTLGKMSKALKKVCLCNLINVILIVFIFVVSFYLIRRLNRVDIETFTVIRPGLRDVCNTTVKNDIKLDPLVNSIKKLTERLRNIDSKLDYLTGFKTVDDSGKTIKYPHGKGKLDTQTKNETEEERKNREAKEAKKDFIEAQQEKRKRDIVKIMSFCDGKENITQEDLMGHLGMKYPDKTKTYSSEEKVKFEEDEAKFNNYISTIDLSTSCPNYNS